MDTNLDYLKINKHSSIPLYVQLKDCIKTAILNGVLQIGDKLPTEQELYNIKQLSRTVTRQAYKELSSEGYIERFKSHGTFVRKLNPSNLYFKEIMSFNREMQINGYTPKTELISLNYVECDSQMAHTVGFECGETLVRIQRLRYRDDTPVVLVDAYYRAKYVPGIEQYDIANNSLYDLLKKHYGISVMHTKKKFKAAIATDRQAKYLDIKPKSAVQYVESIEYDSFDELLSYDISVYAGERNTFEVEINNLSR